MVQLEKTCTNKTATPSKSPLATVVLIPTAGHMLNARRKMGFSLSSPLVTSCMWVLVVAATIIFLNSTIDYKLRATPELK